MLVNVFKFSGFQKVVDIFWNNVSRRWESLYFLAYLIPIHVLLFYFSNETHANFLCWIFYKIIKLNAIYLIVIECGEDQCIKFVFLCEPLFVFS